VRQPSLAPLKSRFPNKSEALLLFTASALIVNFWSIINFLRWVPAFILRLQFSEILIVFCYVQAFALYESIAITLALVLAGALLPKRALRARWVEQGTLFVFITGLLVMAYHNLPDILPVLRASVEYLEEAFRVDVPDYQTTLIIVGFFATATLTTYLILMRWAFARLKKNREFGEGVLAFLERATVLSTLFIVIDLLALAGLLIRYPYGMLR